MARLVKPLSHFGLGPGDLAVPSTLVVPDGRWIALHPWTPTVRHDGLTTVVIGTLWPAAAPGTTLAEKCD